MQDKLVWAIRYNVVVDICDHGASASKRGPLKGVDIIEKELIQSAESETHEAAVG